MYEGGFLSPSVSIPDRDFSWFQRKKEIMEEIEKKTFQSLIGILVDFNIGSEVEDWAEAGFQSLIGILVDFNTHKKK